MPCARGYSYVQVGPLAASTWAVSGSEPPVCLLQIRTSGFKPIQRLLGELTSFLSLGHLVILSNQYYLIFKDEFLIQSVFIPNSEMLRISKPFMSEHPVKSADS